MKKIDKIKLGLKNIRYVKFAVPGHFYSPLPSISEIENDKNTIWPSKLPTEVPGINLNLIEQSAFLADIEKYYSEIPFKERRMAKLRYCFNNPAYSYSDGIFLYTILRKYKPRKVIEVGSGYSSCLLLDTNEFFFDDSMKCTFIEPYPQLLKTLIKESDLKNIQILQNRLQDIPLSIFQELDENDILFIDSTHISKINSDVNYIFHYILPILKKGVLIHFHDIFYPFEYPKSWVYEGRAWNEQYLLRSFLQFNECFKIVVFNTYLQLVFEEDMRKRFPLLYQNTGGSIWLQKLI